MVFLYNKGYKGVNIHVLKELHVLKMTKDNLYFLPLGGSGEIGMNLNLYAVNDKWLMVDLGVSFERALGMDVIMPDPTFIEENADKLVGLVVTHGHEDHIGAIPYLWQLLRCPIYATPFTAFLVRGKLREAGLLSEAEVIEIQTNKEIDLDPFKVTYIPITHSIPEANVIKIETKAGIVVHTGDWKIDPDPQIGRTTDIEHLKALGDEGVLALVCDSTNIFSEGHSGSEGEVRESLLDLIQSQKQRVAVACFASNVARLNTCIEAAKKSGRKIILAGRSLWNMSDAAVHSGYLESTKDFLKDGAFNNIEREKVLLVCTGSQGESRAALTRIANGTHPKIKLEKGDSVIYSSREIPGNEAAIHHTQDELLDAGINVITDYDDVTHVSGHPNQDELKKMYEWTKPKILIPVHGERSHLREHAAFGLECGIPHTLAPRNGMLINLSAKGGPDNEAVVEHGRLALDGTAIVHVKGEHIKKREKLMTCGAIFITLEFDKDDNLKTPVSISIIGLPDIGQEGSLSEDLQLTVQEDVTAIKSKNIQDDDHIQERLSQSTKRFVKALLSKKPIVTIHIVRSC